MKLYFQLDNIRNFRPITAQSDAAFLILVKHAVLLGLKEAGLIDEIGYSHGEDALHKKHSCRKVEFD